VRKPKNIVVAKSRKHARIGKRGSVSWDLSSATMMPHWKPRLSASSLLDSRDSRRSEDEGDLKDPKTSPSYPASRSQPQ